MTEAIHPLSKQLFIFCLSTTPLINLLLQLVQVSLVYQCVLRQHINLVFVCHVGDTHTSSVHYFPLPNNIFNVWQSHHYNPSVCSLCSSCFLSPSNSSHLSAYNVLYVWTTATCLLHIREEKVQDRKRRAFLLSDTDTCTKETSMGLLIKSASGWLGTNKASFCKSGQD